jgi:hypothetical protein
MLREVERLKVYSEKAAGSLEKEDNNMKVLRVSGNENTSPLELIGLLQRYGMMHRSTERADG